MNEPPYPEKPILILDDDPTMLVRMKLVLAKAGIDHVVATEDPATVTELMREGEASLLLLDLFLASASGQTLLENYARLSPQIPVIVVTGTTDTETVIGCMRLGAIDYIVKPVETGRLLASVWNGLSIVELRNEVAAFRDRVLGGRLSRPELFRDIVTADERMLSIFRYVESVAKSRQSVLITGETGTGKELFARAVHVASGRSGPFVAVNVGGLDDAVFADSLFGHRRGAYTGADTQRSGFVKEAAGGTIFLDEVGDLEPRSQIKLLRLLQEGEYYPLGADTPQRSEARVVAATTRDLAAASRSGSFRNDLFYRLQTHAIAIPPLRERRADLSLLVERFLDKSAAALGLPKPELPAGFMEALEAHDFPGNVRELESLIHDAVASAAGGRLDTAGLALRLRAPAAAPTRAETPRLRPEGELPREQVAAESGEPAGPLRMLGDRVPTLREAEEALFRWAIERNAGNYSRAAEQLGISRQTLAKRLKPSAEN